MTRFAIVAAAVALVGTPSLADNAQLAAALGLPAGVFTTAELIQIRHDLEEGNYTGAEFRIEKGMSEVVVTRN